MNEPVIVRLEKYIPRNGGPVVCQVFEEVEVSPGRWIQLDPRNPTPEEVESADDKAIAQQQATIATLTTERDSLQSQVAELTADVQTASSQLEATTNQLAAANATIETLQARIDELENPPNPFPNADWQAFRQAALNDPAVLRVAEGNPVLWPVLFMYLSELSTNPSRGPDIAWLWNTMEGNTPVTSDEVARVNGIAEQFGVPLRMNAEGQIQL